MLPFILVFASIFVFSLLGALSNKFRKENKRFLDTIIEAVLFVLAVNLFIYLFNTHEVAWLFVALVIYIESRVDALKNLMEGE